MVINQSSDDVLKNSLCIYEESPGGKDRPVKKAKSLDTEAMEYVDKNDATQSASYFVFWVGDSDGVTAVRDEIPEDLYRNISIRPSYPIKSLVWVVEDPDGYVNSLGSMHAHLFECTACSATFCAFVDMNEDIWVFDKDNPTDKFMTATKTSALECPSCDAEMDSVLLR